MYTYITLVHPPQCFLRALSRGERMLRGQSPAKPNACQYDFLLCPDIELLVPAPESLWNSIRALVVASLHIDIFNKCPDLRT